MTIMMLPEREEKLTYGISKENFSGVAALKGRLVTNNNKKSYFLFFLYFVHK